MQKYSSIKVFGKCGIKCPGPDCKKTIGNEFKFYLAFENSICDGYITEKFFTILKYDIILVVLGGGKYDDYVSKEYIILFIFILK
jgi:alpha-1,3-fucosyltransferase